MTLPVLWICGPSGIGKTTVGWEIYLHLSQAVVTGYVDIDQLGMCYAEPVSDVDLHRMKAENLGAVIANYRAAGAQCLVVSGVVDVEAGPYAELMPEADLTVCRLSSSTDDLTARFAGRGAYLEQMEQTIRDAEVLDRSTFADFCIDTTGIDAREVTRLILERLGSWPVHQVLWLCGVTGVGKSTVGWQVYMQLRRAKGLTAFADLQQIGFLDPGDQSSHRLKARNLASMWRTYRARGAQAFVVVGDVSDPETVELYRKELADASLTLLRLDAGLEELTTRILLRGKGGGPGIPGDRLKGQPEEALRQIAREEAERAAALQRMGLGDFAVSTDGLSPTEIAEVVLATTWPGVRVG